MSGGRAELGLGTGWFAAEHEAYGIPFPQRRFGLLEEELAIVTGLWGTPLGERFSFSGEHYTLEDCHAEPKPVQSPHLPVLVGGRGGPKSVALCAKWADEYNTVFVGPDRCAELKPQLEQAFEREGRDRGEARLSLMTGLVLGEDRGIAAFGERLTKARGMVPPQRVAVVVDHSVLEEVIA